MSLEAEVARREIKLFVVKRIVGNVHLAILAGNLAVSVDDHSRVVINAGGALFKKRSKNDNFFCRATLPSASVVGPGIVSASLKSSMSSV